MVMACHDIYSGNRYPEALELKVAFDQYSSSAEAGPVMNSQPGILLLLMISSSVDIGTKSISAGICPAVSYGDLCREISG